MFADPKTKVPSLGEIPLLQFVFLDLEAPLEDFFGFGAAHGDMNGDFLVTADAECADGVAGFACGGRGVGVSLLVGEVVGAQRRGVWVEGMNAL